MSTTIVKLALCATLGLAVAAAVPADARACSCLPPDLPTSYNNSSDVMLGNVLGRVAGRDTTYFVFQIRETYKGCTQPGQVVLLSSPAQSAACGIELRPGVSYLITASHEVSAGQYAIGLCGYNRQVLALTEADWQFLDGRYSCCGDDCHCVNDDEVQCFADPCSVESCEEGECTANYCGGCFAEFYTELGQAVCTACRSADDCSWGQVCSRDGECRSACDSHADCEPTQYCGADSACHDCRGRTDLSSADVASRCRLDADPARSLRR
jgi:hypothetical protein